jgi:hypothetical protein
LGKRLETEEFISKATLVHGKKYDYSKSVYKNAKTKIIIICPTHGQFAQTPDNHLRKRGCPKCVGKSWSIKDFIEAAKSIHGNKYDYSKVEYLNKKIKVTIICPVHGNFRQIPYVHLIGCGCPKCVGKSKNFEEIVAEAVNAHGNKYSYLDYTTVKGEDGKWRGFLTIKCNKHQVIWKMTPYSHIHDLKGCKLCGNESSSAKQRSNLRAIKNKIESIHPSYMVPLNQDYYNQHTNVTYICKIHGKQKGRPINLLNGQGCPVCGQESRDEFFRDDWYDVIRRIEIMYPEYHVLKDQIFRNHHTPIVYVCKYHGEKISTANALLSKKAGCDECGIEKRAKSQRRDWINLITAIEEIHKNITIPKKQVYRSVNSHINYVCDKHGIQKATPSKLLQGRGCPECAKLSRHNYSDSAWCKLCGDRNAKLYWLKMKYKDEVWYKFGKTFQSIKDRWWELKKIGIDYEVVRVIIENPEYICKLERRVNRFYKKRHYVPSISFGGHLTECFTIS